MSFPIATLRGRMKFDTDYVQVACDLVEDRNRPEFGSVAHAIGQIREIEEYLIEHEHDV